MSTHSKYWISSAVVAVGILLFSHGCTSSSSSEKTAAVETLEERVDLPSLERVREAAQMAVAIEREPARLAEILEAHGMTADEFQDLLYEIAQDPELTRAFEAARSG